MSHSTEKQRILIHFIKTRPKRTSHLKSVFFFFSINNKRCFFCQRYKFKRKMFGKIKTLYQTKLMTSTCLWPTIESESKPTTQQEISRDLPTIVIQDHNDTGWPYFVLFTFICDKIKHKKQMG